MNLNIFKLIISSQYTNYYLNNATENIWFVFSLLTIWDSFILIFLTHIHLLPLMINSKILKNGFQGLEIEGLDTKRMRK